jgi:hypothetical protein
MDPTVEKAEAAIALTKITIETDGTDKGTSILLNGKPIQNLESFSFNWYKSSWMPLSIGFRVQDTDVKPGSFSGSTWYYLVPPKTEEGNATRAAATIGNGFTLQPTKDIPQEHRRPDERQGMYSQI